MTPSAQVHAILPSVLYLPETLANASDRRETQSNACMPTQGSDPFTGIYPPTQRDAFGATFVLFHHDAGSPFDGLLDVICQTPDTPLVVTTALRKVLRKDSITTVQEVHPNVVEEE